MNTETDEQETERVADRLHQFLADEYLAQCLIDYDGNFNDMGSGDFVAALVEIHEKMRWITGSLIPKN